MLIGKELTFLLRTFLIHRSSCRVNLIIADENWYFNMYVTPGKQLWNKPIPEVFHYSRFLVSDSTSNTHDSWPPTRTILLFVRVQSDFFCILSSGSWLKSVSVVLLNVSWMEWFCGKHLEFTQSSCLWGWSLVCFWSCCGFTSEKMTTWFVRFILLMSLTSSGVIGDTEWWVAAFDLGTAR